MTYVLGFFETVDIFFVHPSFLSFSYLFAAVAGLLQGLLPIQEVSTIETGNSYHGVVKSR